MDEHAADPCATSDDGIKLEYIVYGSGVDPQAVTRAIELSRERYCPAWAMLAPAAPITAASRVVCNDPVLVSVDYT